MNLEKLIEIRESIKKNPILWGFLFTGVPAVFSGGYYAITELNKAIAIRDNFSKVAEESSYAKRKADQLEEKVQEQRETILKLQERLAEAVMAAREAKIVSESNQKELRAGLSAQKVELEVTSSTLRSEMNTLKRATTNRLGN